MKSPSAMSSAATGFGLSQKKCDEKMKQTALWFSMQHKPSLDLPEQRSPTIGSAKHAIMKPDHRFFQIPEHPEPSANSQISQPEAPFPTSKVCVLFAISTYSNQSPANKGSQL
ncbi:MAG: hypothetical protein KDH95_24200, partial [Calditrichaeota bacterium]|nr:hypothetical protein [Calditrichota bacterium]